MQARCHGLTREAAHALQALLKLPDATNVAAGGSNGTRTLGVATDAPPANVDDAVAQLNKVLHANDVIHAWHACNGMHA